MQIKQTVGLSAAILVIVCVPWIERTVVHAQQPQADILPALLSEVKGLRAAMEQMASANAHAQLLVGRLQLQETRMSGMIRRLDSVRDSLVTAQRDYDRISGSIKQFEGQRTAASPPQEELEGVIVGLKREMASAKANVDRLTAEETQLMQELTLEQGRWVEINQRLDELERSLTKK